MKIKTLLCLGYLRLKVLCSFMSKNQCSSLDLQQTRVMVWSDLDAPVSLPSIIILSLFYQPFYHLSAPFQRIIWLGALSLPAIIQEIFFPFTSTSFVEEKCHSGDRNIIIIPHHISFMSLLAMWNDAKERNLFMKKNLLTLFYFGWDY